MVADRPILAPCLPPAGHIAAYLPELDRRGFYTNRAPLARRLEARLAALAGARQPGGPPVHVAAASSGTSALTAALLAQDLPGGAGCLVPSWTFAGTVQAIGRAGLTPVFADIDPASWALTPELAERARLASPVPIQAVVPVAPFGAPPPAAAWTRFAEATGVAVVVDAAACGASVQPAGVLQVLSLHATKLLSCGEGGAVLAPDPGWAERIHAVANFGFADGTVVRAGLNAKLSEYHAAVGHAALDRWDRTLAWASRMAGALRRALEPTGAVAFQAGLGEAWATSTVTVAAADGAGDALAERIQAAGLPARRWWAGPCHAMPAFGDCPQATGFAASWACHRASMGLPLWAGDDAAALARLKAAVAGD